MASIRNALAWEPSSIGGALTMHGVLTCVIYIYIIYIITSPHAGIVLFPFRSFAASGIGLRDRFNWKQQTMPIGTYCYKIPALILTHDDIMLATMMLNLTAFEGHGLHALPPSIVASDE